MRILLAAILALTISVSTPECLGASSPDRQALDALNLFGSIFEKIKEEYVEDIPYDKLTEDAISGMLSNLDPHSGYLNPQNFKEMKLSTKGEFGGLGIEITMESGVLKVISPMDDTPASKSGVQAGDFITAINNTPVIGMSLMEAVEMLRGEPKTVVKITIVRTNAKEPIELSLTRDIIKISPVTAKIADKIFYVRISSFTEKATENLIREINKYNKNNTSIHGVILDLRNNAGGLLDQAVSVADIFLDGGEIVSTRGRRKEDSSSYNAKKGSILSGIPVVVLINNGSASASEIVAGALQDHKRAVVMGTRSFGKGSVQTIIPIKNNGAIRITTSRYYTPSGRSIQAKGIEPDIVVEQAKIESENKKAITESDLHKHLKNKQGSGADNKNQDTNQDNSLLALYEKDYQIVRAADLLKGIILYKEQQNTKVKR